MEYVQLLRYGPRDLRGGGTVHMTLAQIAKLLGCSATHVAGLLAEARGRKPIKQTSKPGRRTKLRREHVAYLVHRDTLQMWAAKSLMERVMLFHRTFPEIKISKLTLLRVYRSHGITRKCFRFVKTLKIKDPAGRP
jgi:MarR-like DNA-binding transcriptional regulator SgrR of sgrS sRNA